MKIEALADALAGGDRRALARAITLVESGRADHRVEARRLLERLAAMPPSAGRQALRLGLTGTPGVGKSSFIEALGLHLTGRKLRVAVLAVDPSSARSGGSILGDKTRMERLSRDPLAFIRPSPSQTQLGGVARRTREAVALCESAGFDVVIIETVGVGQSETAVAALSDIFLLLLAPAGGDELQGVKRGIMEMADIVLVNKADGALKSEALRTCGDYAGALRLMRRRSQDPEGYPLAMTVSAATGDGIAAAWAAVEDLAGWRRAQGIWQQVRAEQARHWFHEELRAEMLAVLAGDPRLKDGLARMEAAVAAGDLSPNEAAARTIAPLLAPLGHTRPASSAGAQADGCDGRTAVSRRLDADGETP
ncbi:MAG: methylmalonyl Co-A mutase-associated GTPase MeaB [Rubellimicrobium sp.]|nr:methylmalonyl Co-A mutase-associated GTPase MeaB [Rubellimicrobium sp.]